MSNAERKVIGELIGMLLGIAFNTVVGWKIGHLYGEWLGWLTFGALGSLNSIYRKLCTLVEQRS